MEDLSQVDFDRLLQDKNVDECWETFQATINDAISRYIPLVNRRKKGDPPWVSKPLKRMLRRKRRKWRSYIKNRSEERFRAFKEAEKECKKAVQAAKRRFERSLAESKNKRPFNAYIKSRSKCRTNVGPLKVNGELLSENRDMAEALNQFFASVFTKNSANIVPIDRECQYEMRDLIIPVGKVKKKLENLKPESAPGPDGITAFFLKTFAAQVASPLTVLFNKSLQEGVVPEDWRLANVTPIFKKGSKASQSNYRPVSLTSIMQTDGVLPEGRGHAPSLLQQPGK